MRMTNVSPKNIKAGISIPDVATTFRYIKFEILSNNGDAITTVGDINYIINSTSLPPTMNGFATSGYQVIDWSSYYNTSSTYEPWKAFDDATGSSNRWLVDNAGSQYVTLDLSSTFNVSDFTEVRMFAGTHIEADWTTRSVRDFKVLVSSDDVSYTEILSVTGINDWQSGVEKTFTIT